MAEINLMDQYPRPRRPVVARGKLKLSGKGRINLRPEAYDQEDIFLEQVLLNVARRFGKEYFDGDRLYGYGGYEYHPRFWTKTARRIVEHYHLDPQASVLDVGCAKGFLLYDLRRLYPGLQVAGVDISDYAIEHAKSEIKDSVQVGDAQCLPYPDSSFDLVVSINTVSNLPLDGCKQAVREIQRVSRRHAFLGVHAWRTNKQHENFLKWNLTALTYMHVDDWLALFEEVGYEGDYYWSFID